MTVLDFAWPGIAIVERRTPTDAGARVPRTLPRFLDFRSDAVFAQLVRFALVGGLSNVFYAAAFVALHADGALLANVVGSVVSTVVANELHRRLTFHASERVGWFAAQWEGGGLAAIGLVASTAALAALNFLFPGTTGLVQALFVIGVSAVVGGLRFLALRGWVF